MIGHRFWLASFSSRHRWRGGSTRVETIGTAETVRRRSGSGRRTAGIIVIGDEILKGQVKETNSQYARRLLYEYGVKVEKISMVRDNAQAIAQEAREFRDRFDYVFTCGGIGPTHDDVTYEAVASAFGDTLHYHPILVDIVRKRFARETFPSAAYKMAHIPRQAELEFGRDEATGRPLAYPCVAWKNVRILPGSPGYFESAFRSLCKEWFGERRGFAVAEVFVDAPEESFAEALAALAAEFPRVSFGSYPERSRYYQARVTIESETEEETEAARRAFRERAPAAALVPYDRAPHLDCLAKFESLLRSAPRRAVYERTLQQFLSWGEKPETICALLDGSDESILVIHLARVALEKLERLGRLGRPDRRKLTALHFAPANSSSPETKKFFIDLGNRYEVEVRWAEGEKADAARAIGDLAAAKAELRLLLVGNRSSIDERRISEDGRLRLGFPLLDWSTEDVATLCRSLSLPYLPAEA